MSVDMKYAIHTNEGDFELGSNGAVLKNKLGIVSEQDMIDAEEALLLQLYEHLFETDAYQESITIETIQKWHRIWLGNVYAWSGEFRSVNMSKGDFQFAGALQLPKLAVSFEQRYLTKFNNMADVTEVELIQLLTESHVEFILMHPFREGNGRISRLLMDVMVTQAGYEPLDYSLMEQHREYYFKSIQAGVVGDYQHLNKLLTDVFKQSNL